MFPAQSTTLWSQTGQRDPRWQFLAVCVFLAVIVCAVFGQTFHHEFLGYDDDCYVYSNPLVLNGLTWEGIAKAFLHPDIKLWSPVTTLSHMLTREVFGMDPGKHHLVNVVLHGANAILLFMLLRQMTGFLWRSAFVAAVFAIHPLRVESVAWISERKDVLSGFFFMLTLLAWLHYLRQPRSTGRYALALVLFALGLMSKPMLVTLPFLLLLLDYWPLRRFELSAKILLEKLPFFLLSLGSCAVTLIAGRDDRAMAVFHPLSERVANSLISSVVYIGQMFFPRNLVVLYGFPSQGIPLWQVVLAAGLLLAISAWVCFRHCQCPSMLAGWLWYLGMLIPVIGVIQVGAEAHADRYTYLPQIGLYVACTWFVAELPVRFIHRRIALGFGALVVLASLMVSASVQTGYWSDGERLWRRANVFTKEHYLIQGSLGLAILQKGRTDEAIDWLQKALRLKPDYLEAANNLGFAFLLNGRVDTAIVLFQRILKINPDYEVAQSNFGNALRQKGSIDEAIAHCRKALELRPYFPVAQYHLGLALFEKGEIDETILQCSAAAKSLPKRGMVHHVLANALFLKGRIREAVIQWKEALRIQPGIVDAQNNLAWVLATSPDSAFRNGKEAVELAEEANRATGGIDPNILTTAAAAYAEAGRLPEAMVMAQRGLELSDSKNPIEIEKRRLQSQFYKAGKPYRDISLK